MKKYTYPTLIGSITLKEMDGAISSISTSDKTGNEYEYVETPLIRRAMAQILEYLEGERKTFDFPIAWQGTPFQIKVWEALRNIPYGETRNYGQIAAAIGNPKASRAVGMANNRNPLLIVVPCHRVVGADGSLVGYAAGLSIKKHLLELERGEAQMSIPMI